MPAGRPTDYLSEYCETVIEYCKDGNSLTAFAASIGVARQTITEWGNVHPEFSAAVKKAKAQAGLWWETKLKGHCDGTSTGNTTAAIFGVKNFCPDDFKDDYNLRVGNIDDKPLSLVITKGDELI